ncbi:Retrovirus-related Pol polyprotein from transposon TNT 1-94 [Cucumis melo var. makuwa]|uniref:Retrovirus-related Pol polyprotein from transposon TNT 1-94 n=1 Tax=Cucumis melo var. makuwa TaxID=1194695 RepID=A0A5A7T856_CUCMM|nr:Retrovirus-related Pol polyprotein from transposon TNT 1-94 [Cucumis melo var. makuwa]TYK29654.1 Retrovirus-related Pol polyprotein from transposon TNT 1-94 [Cucumis melo var. makuwa]
MTTDNFVQPAIPRFDGHYDHWSMLMENFLRFKEYWQVVESRVLEPAPGAILSDTQKSELLSSLLIHEQKVTKQEKEKQKTLQQKNIVTWLPQIEVHAEVCEECVVSKQHQDPFPTGKSGRAKRPLELDKSEAFIAFRSYKVQVEKEIGSSIKVLHTGHGAEYISREFETFCENNGIKRQLTAAYMPQQNGVCERKNRTLLNMVRSLLMKSGIPRTF